MPSCYTCGEDITFDKNILSKTGKQIPLTPDKKYTHGHDEQGNPTKKPLPNQGLNQEQTEQFNQYNRQQPKFPPMPAEGSFQQQQQVKPSSGFTATGQSQGGSYMDTKRLRVMVEELQKQVNELEAKIESHVIIDSNRYENQMTMIYDKLGPLMDSTLTAAEMYKKKQQKPEAEMKGWNSVEPGQRQDFPVEKTLKEDDDDDDKILEEKGI